MGQMDPEVFWMGQSHGPTHSLAITSSNPSPSISSGYRSTEIMSSVPAAPPPAADDHHASTSPIQQFESLLRQLQDEYTKELTRKATVEAELETLATERLDMQRLRQHVCHHLSRSLPISPHSFSSTRTHRITLWHSV